MIIQRVALCNFRIRDPYLLYINVMANVISKIMRNVVEYTMFLLLCLNKEK
jgi:hypothetical protein